MMYDDGSDAQGAAPVDGGRPYLCHLDSPKSERAGFPWNLPTSTPATLRQRYVSAGWRSCEDRMEIDPRLPYAEH